MGLRPVGRQACRRMEMRGGFADALLSQQLVPQRLVGAVVVLGDRERACEQGFGVAPGSYLSPCDRGEGQQHRAGRRGYDSAGDPPARGERWHTPRNGQREADQGQVHVAICSRLHPHLHQADDRNEHAEVPQPSHGQVRVCLCESETHPREDCQDQDGSADLEG